ncbi:DEAD/DEAH box helicase [Fredinandcohnia quinoae]|uniref:DEAD/DEAH box helicase n=1 Tax=Fredinandcohnia quinoae TaxID=2918902 RepID=A0AAW5E390_9BACI|nr:DEAD/DEAH box helicase [Fredinandcohnia sp. SECRCQ15]MCH1625700.1 DEAD/DEAH box helicase [Fredinandcohnia sp. SECRCQ15]
MNIKVNHKIIQDMCGTVSFKRGDAFYRANKVSFETYSPDFCEATVSGTEDFTVTIEVDPTGDFHSTCSCPKLVSFQKDCQHIAAVLLSIYEHQKQGIVPSARKDSSNLSESLLTLFNQKPFRSSKHQLHFEKRKVLEVLFTCKPVFLSTGQYMFGIEMQIESINILQIREFLKNIQFGNASKLSIKFTYDPSQHCFLSETDAVIQQLIQVVRDEKIFVDSFLKESEETIQDDTLLIPPSSWERLLPFLIDAPNVKLIYDGIEFEGVRLSDHLLPIQFKFEEDNNNGFLLKIKGMTSLLILDSYHYVLSSGKLIKLKAEDCNRLLDLKKMLENTGTNEIHISKEQLNTYIEKVVPGLKRLGTVILSNAISKQYEQTPLQAKLFLDRVNNRLLAGLEFHYENIVINPLEPEEFQAVSTLIRNEEKEEDILTLMDEGLFTKTDGGYFLHNEQLEYEFLYNIVPKLHQHVQVYATTAVRNRIFRKNSFPKIRVKVKKERTNWLEFKFEMDGIPEKQIREVLQALEEKRKYYRLRNGSLLSLETKEFEEISRFLQELPEQEVDLEKGLNVPIVKGIKLLHTTDGDQIFTFEDSFRQFIDSIHNPDRLQFDVPKSLESILRNYQKHGFSWMKTLASYGFGGILADDMGLGKTLQSIAFIVSELDRIRESNHPVLIVCPSSLTYNWLNELMKFAPNVQAIVIDGNKIERSKIQNDVTGVDVFITSYPLLRRDLKWYEQQDFHTVFFDEAQNFKNPITKTSRAVKRIQANYRFALTGTPVENSSEELWSIFHVVFPELFGGLKDFSHLTRKTIARRIQPFLLRRLKKDVLHELPEKIESIDSVELLPDQKKLYGAYLAKLKHDTLKHLDKETFRKNRIRILAGLTRLRQICCHPGLFVDGYKGSSGKFEQLMQIIEEAKLSGRRILIFSQFTKMLALIGRELSKQGDKFFYLDGQTPSDERIEICERFNEGERDLFLISLKAGGTGLNLTGADTVILYDIWWNPAVEEQAADRAYRIGQTKEVQVIKLIARGTIEEKINELQDKKRQLIEEIIDSEDNIQTTLTEDDIREILMI